MPFAPDLAQRVESVRAKLEGGDTSGSLQAKLAKREQAGGYTQNVNDIREALANQDAE